MKTAQKIEQVFSVLTAEMLRKMCVVFVKGKKKPTVLGQIKCLIQLSFPFDMKAETAPEGNPFLQGASCSAMAKISHVIAAN